MIDDVTLTMNIDPPIEVKSGIAEPFEYKGIQFNPKFRDGIVTYYYGELGNLHARIKYDKLFLKNSWHKFFHGNNYCDYTRGDVKHTIEKFADIFGEDFWNAEIIGLSIGCNIHTDAKDFYSKLISGKTKMFQEMKAKKTHTTYGKYLPTTNIKDKFYDKQFEVKDSLRKNIPPTLRIEREISRIKYVQNRVKNPFEISKPSDLITVMGWSHMAHELLIAVSQVQLSTNFNPEMIEDFKDIEVLVFMSDPRYREVARKRLNSKTYRKWANRYLEIKEIFDSNDYKSDMLEVVEDKLVELGKM